MSSKFYYFLIVLIASQSCHVRGRFVDGNGSSIESSSSESKDHGLTRVPLSKNTNTNTLESIKELTEDDIKQMKSKLSKELTPVQMVEFDRILNLFKKGTSTKEHIEGMIQLLVFSVAVRSNATDVDISKIFNEDVQSTTVETITLNNNL